MRGAATKAMSDIVEDPELRSGRAPPGCGPQARWLCCALLTYRPGYCSSLAPRQRAWGPAAKCEVISARALRGERSRRPDEYCLCVQTGIWYVLQTPGETRGRVR